MFIVPARPIIMILLSDWKGFTAMWAKERCGRTSPVDLIRSAIISKWSCRQQRKKREKRRTSRRAVRSSPCFITVSLGTRFVVPVQPRRCPCSIWAAEHGTTRPCRNSTPRQQSRRLRRHRMRPSRRRLECIFKQRIWRPLGEEAAIDCWHRSSLAGDVAGAWALGATCPGRPSDWMKGSLISVSDVIPVLAATTSFYFIKWQLTRLIGFKINKINKISTILHGVQKLNWFYKFNLHGKLTFLSQHSYMVTCCE